MKILIVGVGAIGIYLGCKISDVGHSVTLVGRRKLRSLGDSITIDKKKYPVVGRAYKIPKNEKFNFIFIASKINDVKKILEKLKKNNIKSKHIIGIQNGFVDHLEYEKYLKGSKFVSVSVFEGFRVEKNILHVSHSKKGWKTNNSKEGLLVAKFLRGANIRCTVENNLERIRAEKMLINCSVNVISAVECKTFYDMVRDKKIRVRMNSVFDETYNVLNKILKMKNREVLRKALYDMVMPMHHFSSTCQDVMDKVNTEVDFLNGWVTEHGKKFKVNVKENEKLVKEFKGKFK